VQAVGADDEIATDLRTVAEARSNTVSALLHGLHRRVEADLHLAADAVV
jgi:hypothetical protein